MNKALISAALAASLMVLPASAAEFSEKQKAEIEKIARDYLLKHPEVLQEMMQALQDKQARDQAAKQTSAISDQAKTLFRSDNDFVAGNPKGDVTMVEFFDYNCGYCKKGFPEVMSLMDKDKNLRVVLKELPVIGGENSVYAAKAAIASIKQGKYWELHQALISFQGHVTPEVVDQASTDVGLNLAQLKKDMDSPETLKVLESNLKLSDQMSISGTPAFVIGDQVIGGYVPEKDLASTVEAVRQSGACNKLC